MKYLILGGNGFIGKNITRRLAGSNHKITVMDLEVGNQLPGVVYADFDITNDKDISTKLYGYDIIIDLISTVNPASSEHKPVNGYQRDVAQRVKMLEVLKTTKTRIIFASSGGTVYGDPDRIPVSEKDELRPICHYGNIKITIENLLRQYNRRYGMKNVILRIGNPYGPGQDYLRGVGVIDAFIHKILTNQEIVLIGNSVRDYIYIDDLCDAFLRVSEYQGMYDTFNIATGKGTSLHELLGLIEEVSHKKANITQMEKRDLDVERIVLDITLAEQELGFSPQESLKEGLVKTYEYILSSGK